MLLPGKEVFKVHEDYSTLLPPANEVWGKVMFLHLSVILFTGGGGSAPLHAGIHSPGRDTTLGRHPLGRNPLGQTSPLGRHSSSQILEATVNKWAVRILLECILVIKMCGWLGSTHQYLIAKRSPNIK